MTELIDAYGLNVVQAYMQHIQVHSSRPCFHFQDNIHLTLELCLSFLQENAEVAVREMLKEIGEKTKVQTSLQN